MKITHAKFIKLLAAELGQDEKIIGIHVNGLVSEIINTVDTGKPYKIAGFGSFTSRDGALVFEPEERFAAEINYNYEGMPEIDVNEAKSVVDDEPSEPVSVRKSDTIIIDENVADEEIDQLKNETIELSDEDLQSEYEELDADDIFGISESDKSTDFELYTNDKSIDEVSEGSRLSSASASEPTSSPSSASSEEEQIEEEEELLAKQSAQDEPDEPFSINEPTSSITPFEEETEEALPNSADEETSFGMEEEDLAEEESSFDLAVPVFSEDEDSSEEEYEQELLEPDQSKDDITSESESTSRSTVKKPEAVVKVGNIVGKKTPVATKKTKNKSEETKSEDESTDSAADTDFTKQRPLPGDRRKADTNFTVIILAIAAVMLISVGVWWYLGNRETPVPTAGEMPFAGTSQTMIDEVPSGTDGSDQDVAESGTLTDAQTDSETQASEMAQGSVGSASQVASSGEPAATTLQPASASQPAVSSANWEESRPVGTPSTATSSTVPEATQTTPAATQVVTQEAAAASQVTETTEQQSPYGLRGESQPMDGRVYAIIVHSLSSREEGNIQCNEIARLGLRCVVVETVVNNRTTYRVAVGQFRTARLAEQRIPELPEPYRSRNFLARIN